MKSLSTQRVYLVIQSLILPGVFVLSISTQMETFPQEHSSNSDYSVSEFYSMTESTSLEEVTRPDFNKPILEQIKPVVSTNDSSIVTRHSESLFPKSSIRSQRFDFLLCYPAGNNSQNFNSLTSQSKNNSSNDISSVVLKNITYYDICNILNMKEGCMQSGAIKCIQNQIDTLNTNVTDLTSSTVRSNDVENCSSETLCILTQYFHCDIDKEDELSISCRNVTNIYSINKYLPNDTVVLDISYSYQVKLPTSLIPHLKSLKSLTLTYNHHRFITTKAFIGLENLERLDLSNNDIMALLRRTFLAIPRLKVLNLSSNRLLTIRVVSEAVSSLKNLQKLSLDHNSFGYIVKKDLLSFVNCKIEVLSLFNTTIKYVEKGAFTFLPKLKVLNLSINYVNEYALANLTCSITNTIEVLSFRSMLRIRSLPYDTLHCLSNTNLKELDLGGNYIRIITGFPSLPNLLLLSLSYGTIEAIAINAFENLTNLELLHLSHNKLKYFPEALSSIKSLKELDLGSQDISTIFTIKDYAFQQLVNLETIGLSSLPLKELSRYCLNGLKNLNFTSLSFAGLSVIKDFAFETHKSVTVLDLRGNGLSFLGKFTFYGLENLNCLLLTANKISYLSYPFQHSPLLRMLFLQSNSISSLPEGIFSNLENLKMLSLKANKIIPWKKRIFHPNASLSVLELPANNIGYITHCMLSEFHQVKWTLDLSQNPFNCRKCGMKEFQTFFKNSNLSSNSILSWKSGKSNSTYVCLNPESMRNEPFFEIDLSEDLCQEIESEVFSLITIIIICLIFISLIFILSLCYLFRWYVRYGIFHFKTSLVKNKVSHRNKTYQYDAFIIYSSTDTAWVEDYLMPTLEEQEPRYKLCVHQRDFIAGNKITENILEAIDNSHKVIIIFTEDFIKSEWCMYELHLAQHKLFGDTRNILILIKLGSIDKKLYSKNVSYVEKTRKCFTWSNNPMGQKLFWEQIRKELGPSRVRQNLISI